MRKKIISFILCLCMLLTMVPSLAFAENPEDGLATVECTTPDLGGAVVTAKYFVDKTEGESEYFQALDQQIVCNGESVLLYDCSESCWERKLTGGGSTSLGAFVLFETDDPTVEIEEQWYKITSNEHKNETLPFTTRAIDNKDQVITVKVSGAAVSCITISGLSVEQKVIPFASISAIDAEPNAPYSEDENTSTFAFTASFEALGIPNEAANSIKILSYAENYYYESEETKAAVSFEIITDSSILDGKGYTAGMISASGVTCQGSASPAGINAWKNGSLLVAYDVTEDADYTIKNAAKDAVYNIYVGNSPEVTRGAFELPEANGVYQTRDKETGEFFFVVTTKEDAEANKPESDIKMVSFNTPHLEGRVVKATYYTTADVQTGDAVYLVCDGTEVQLKSSAPSDEWGQASKDGGKEFKFNQGRVLFETDDPTVKIEQQWFEVVSGSSVEILPFTTKEAIDASEIITVIVSSASAKFDFEVKNLEVVELAIPFTSFSAVAPFVESDQQSSSFAFTKTFTELNIPTTAGVLILGYTENYYSETSEASGASIEFEIITGATIDEAKISASGVIYKDAVSPQAINAWKNNSLIIAYNTNTAVSRKIEKATKGAVYKIYVGESAVDVYSFTTATAAQYVYEDQDATYASFVFTDSETEYEPHKPYTGPDFPKITVTTPALEGRIVKASYYTTSDIYYTTVAIVCDGKPVELYSGETSNEWKKISQEKGKTGAQANVLFETDDPTVQINEQWTWFTKVDKNRELRFTTKPGVQAYKIVVDDCVTTPFTFTVNNVEYISTKVSFLTMSDGHIVQPKEEFNYTKTYTQLGLPSGTTDVAVINYPTEYYTNTKKGGSTVTVEAISDQKIYMHGKASGMGATKTAWKHNSFTLAYKDPKAKGQYTYTDANGGYQYNIYNGNSQGESGSIITKGSFVLPNKTSLKPIGASGEEPIYVYEKWDGNVKVFHLTNKPYALMGASVEPKFERLNVGTASPEAIEAFLTSEDALDVWAYYGLYNVVTFDAIEARRGYYNYENDPDDQWRMYHLTQAAAGDPAGKQYTLAAVDTFDREPIDENTTSVSILIQYNDEESIGLTSVTAEAIVLLTNSSNAYIAEDGADNPVISGTAARFNDANGFAKYGEGGSIYGAVSGNKTYQNDDYHFGTNGALGLGMIIGDTTEAGIKTYKVEYKPYVTYASVGADFQYVLGGENSFVSYGEFTAAALTDAGLYKVTECVRRVADDPETEVTTAAFFYKTFYFVIDQADLDIRQAVDTVYTDTKIQNHTFKRNVAGMNGETVYGEFTFAAENSDGWGNAEDRSASPSTPLQTGIQWEFNVYETAYGGGSGDGRKNLNNYLDQFDGPSAETSASGDVQNSYYKGSNGVLSYSQNGAYVRHADMTLNMTVSGEAVARYTTDTAVAETSEGIFAEYISIGGVIGNEDELGYRVVSGDAISGDTEFGTKIKDSSALPAGYQNYFNDLVAAGSTNNLYKGDLYVITVKASGEAIKTIKYTDKTAAKTVNNIASALAEQGFNDLPACEYYGIDAYEVEVKYIGLYYTSNTGDDKRDPSWQGGEEFNWVVSELRFPLDIEQREVVLKGLTDLNKIYDGTDKLVRQTTTGDDVTGAAKYIIDLEATNANDQFNKKLETVLDNYADPSNGAEDHMAIELAGTYSDANKGADKNVTITAVRLLHYQNISGKRTNIPANGDKVAALNYKLVMSDAAVFKGTVDVAKMHFTHEKYGTMLVYDDKPMHDLFGISAKAYLLTVTDGVNGEAADGFYDVLTMTEKELTEENDASKGTAFTTGTAFDYAVSYSIIKDDTKYGPNFSDPDLKINEETGAVEKVSVKSIGENDPSVFPAMKITVTSFGNFTLVPGSETSETDVFNTCKINEGTENSTSASDETWTHDVLFRIIGNNNSYDLLIPVNQLNKRVSDGAFINRTGGRVSVGSEYYDYVTVYPNGDEVTFSFTIPQDSYLEDVKIVDVKKVASAAAFEVLLASGTAIGSFSDQATAGGMNSIANPLFLTLDKVNGSSGLTDQYFYSKGTATTEALGYSGTSLAAANLQIGGSKFEFTFKTGSCSLGANYAIAIVPVIKPIGKLITDGAFTVTDDAINVSFSAVRDFSGTAEDSENKVYGNLVFMVSGAAAKTFNTTWGAITREGDYIIPVKTASYAAFFDPEKLLAGTEVKISLDVWRDGALSGVQTDSAVDADVFDKIELTWTVSEDDYDTLFADETVQFYDGETFLGYGIISAGTIDFANVTFVAAEANPTAELKNFTNYTKTDYTFNAWCTDAGLTNPVVYNEGTSIAAVSGGDVFYLKATYTPPYTPGPSGSGSSTPKSYEITLEDVENGSVSTDKTSAVKGETVVLTLTPDDGYEVLAFIVLDKNGKEIETKDLGNGSYSFEMPASKINIKSAFEKKTKTFFVDVPADAYFYEPVFWAADCGITDGVDETHFAPDLGVKRAQVVTFLWRTAGKPEPAGTAPVFTDVVSGSYYEKAVAWAYEQGITKGTTETTFSPEDTCLRGQVAAFLARFAGVMDTDTASVFSDVKSTDYFAAAVKWAKDNKITDGTSATTFSPKLECTRGQIVTFLYRYVMR